MNAFSFIKRFWTGFRVVLIVFLFITCSHIRSFGQEKDSIYLYKGQILIGEVQDASLGTLTIDETDLKLQSIKLYKIKRLIISSLFKIQTVDKKIYYGTLKTEDKEGWVDIVTDNGDRIPIHITDIFTLTTLDQNFFKRVHGNVSAGLSFSKSSNIGQVNFSGTALYSTTLFAYELSASEIGSIDSSKFSRDNENAQFFVAYELSPVWFLAGVAQYQRNLQLSIARRYMGIFGAGNKLFIRDDWQLLVLSGISLSQEKSTEGSVSGLLIDLPLMFRFNYYKFHHPDIQISTTLTGYYSLSESNRFRSDGTTDFSWQLIRYFYLKISPYTNYDSKPPSSTGSKFDYGIVVSLSYRF
jgi:hypothetical protein